MNARMEASAGGEEREQQKRQYDEAATALLFAKLNNDLKARAEKEAARLAALREVKVADADVALVAQQLAIDAAAARLKLQEHKGDAVATLRAAAFLG